MKKILLSVAFVVATITGANAQSVTYTNEEVSLTGLNGLNIFPNGTITGTLTAIEISATKVSGAVDAGELAIYITPTSAFGTGGLVYAGGTTNAFVNAAEWQTWPNNDGTDISGIITLDTPISFPAGTTNFVRLANLLSPATAGVWSDVTVTLHGVSEPEPTDYCSIFVGGPYTDFNSMFEGAPTTEGVTNEITEFECWASEAYTIDGFVQGNEYTFSICNGPGAGSWIPDFIVIAPNGDIVTYGADDDGCSITWTATENGTYIIGINEAENCGVANQIDNGYPAITNNGVASTGNFTTSTFSVYPNPVKDVLNISNSMNAEINTVIVTDINGRTVKQFGAVSQINVSDLNAGVYFVNINSNEGSTTKKIVKQ